MHFELEHERDRDESTRAAAFRTGVRAHESDDIGEKPLLRTVTFRRDPRSRPQSSLWSPSCFVPANGYDRVTCMPRLIDRLMSDGNTKTKSKHFWQRMMDPRSCSFVIPAVEVRSSRAWSPGPSCDARGRENIRRPGTGGQATSGPVRLRESDAAGWARRPSS
jgi:hypothetical protein